MFKKLFRAMTSGDDDPPPSGDRSPQHIGEVAVGDLLTFKHRMVLPEALQGQTYEVSEVGTYQFDDGLYMQVTLTGTARDKLYLGFDPKEPQGELCLSRDIPRSELLQVFDEDAFADLWEDGFSELTVVATPESYQPWLASSYAQVKNSAVGYYFDTDKRGANVSDRVDDDSDELRYHECTGDNDSFGLTVEIWGDGETDVTLDLYVPGDVIESLWPGSS